MIKLMNIASRAARAATKSTHVILEDTIASVLGREPKTKVFAIGFNNRGTTSLHVVFRELGYHSYHGERWRRSNARWIHRSFSAFCDGIPEDFTLLDKKFPNSKFILQVRDLDKWISSRIEHILRYPNTKWKKVSADWTVDDSSVESWVLQRNEHHLEVLKYFKGRQDDLLITNFVREPDAAKSIASFLGSETNIKKPHAHINRNNRSIVLVVGTGAPVVSLLMHWYFSAA